MREQVKLMTLKKKSNNSLTEIIDLINQHDDFLITSHVSPDGDNLGSVIALDLFLKQLGKRRTLVIDDTLPSSFSYLSNFNQIKSYHEGLEADFEVAFVLDCSDLGRIGDVKNLINNEEVINIDHHNDNPYYGSYNLVKNTAATAVLIYDLIKAYQGEITLDIATSLATALITDTGSFCYSNTSAKTHYIMAELMETGINTAKICKELLATHSYENLLLRGQVLNNLKVDPSGKVAWIKVAQKMLADIGATLDDTEGIVDYPRSLAGVEVAVLFKEVEDEIVRVSLRSNEYFPVDKVAHQFNGGGHPRAAGCTIEGSLVEAEFQVINAIKMKLEVD